MTDYMTGEEVAYAFIVINERKLWLDHYAMDDDVVVGWEGDSEQCEDCGEDIEESGKFTYHRKTITCRCGMEYEVQYKMPERGGPPYDAATATGMYDRECDTP
jgi:hypothetical protein